MVSVAAAHAGQVPQNELPAGWQRFNQTEHGKVRIEGERPYHPWQIESHAVGGFLDLESDFAVEPGAPSTPRELKARAEIVTVVGTLKSLNRAGEPYSDKMDRIVHAQLKAPEHPRILFQLSELRLNEGRKSEDGPYLMEAAGELVAAGKTNKITIPVKVTPLGPKRLKLESTFWVKPQDYGIPYPPSFSRPLEALRSEVVKVAAEWVVGAAKPREAGITDARGD